MMKLRQSLKNSVKAALLFSLTLIVFLFSGCSSSTEPTFKNQNICQAITKICKKEYGIDVRVNIVGSTLWIYYPTRDIVEETDKPERSVSLFSSEFTAVEQQNDDLKVSYLIKPITPTEELQRYRANKKVGEKINKIWSVLRRVVFSTDKTTQKEPQFYYVVSADIKNGFEIEELAYYLDLKKFSYSLMSVTEYQHRSIQEIKVNPAIIGDMRGKHLLKKNISMDDFIAAQIKYRLKLRFQKPEATKNIDIDKEVLKIVAYTIKSYNYKDFNEVEISNLYTKSRTVLNRTAILQTTAE